MAGLFDCYDDLRDRAPGAFLALKYCIKRNICISGRCVEWLVENHPELIIDEVYDDFEGRSRWFIAKAYILNIDGEWYRCWEEAGLTEMQPNDWLDQTLEKVVQKEITVTAWIAEEEEFFYD